LQTIEPDTSDLPAACAKPSWRPDASLPDFNDVANRDLDEEITHTSLVICADSGIQCILKPAAVSSVAQLLDVILPKAPNDLLDILQIQVMSQLLGLEKRKKGDGDALEVAVRVPSIAVRFLNAFEAAEVGPRVGVDQYDLEIKHLALTLRQTKQPIARRGDTKDSVLVHCTAESISLSVHGQTQDPESHKLMICCSG
jgi:hypothetical protein